MSHAIMNYMQSHRNFHTLALRSTGSADFSTRKRSWFIKCMQWCECLWASASAQIISIKSTTTTFSFLINHHDGVESLNVRSSRVGAGCKKFPSSESDFFVFSVGMSSGVRLTVYITVSRLFDYPIFWSFLMSRLLPVNRVIGLSVNRFLSVS